MASSSRWWWWSVSGSRVGWEWAASVARGRWESGHARISLPANAAAAVAHTPPLLTPLATVALVLHPLLIVWLCATLLGHEGVGTTEI